jgi:hypothetical protein
MKTLVTLFLLSVLFISALLPGSNFVIESVSDMPIAGRVGGGGIPRPRNADEQSIFEIDLGSLLAGKVGTGGIPRPMADEQPVFEIDLGNLLAGRMVIGTRPRA